MTKIKPSDIKLKIKKSTFKGSGFSKFMDYTKEDVNQRLSELINILEEPINLKKKFSDKGEKLLYVMGFRDGEEAHKKKMREVFTKNG